MKPSYAFSYQLMHEARMHPDLELDVLMKRIESLSMETVSATLPHYIVEALNEAAIDKRDNFHTMDETKEGIVIEALEVWLAKQGFIGLEKKIER